MLNQKKLYEQLKQISALNEPLLEIPPDKLQMQEEINSEFYREIAPILPGYPLVEPYRLKSENFPDDFAIIGVDGSPYTASPPNYRSSFSVTNTAVFSFFPKQNEYDFRIYTNVYPNNDEDEFMLKEDATLYMLADEVAGAAKFISEEITGPVVILFDGMTYSALDSYLTRQRLGVTQDASKHASNEIYRSAIELIHKYGALSAVVSSQPRTSYISPVVQYNACPYKDNLTMPMNCHLCREKKAGYNFECEPYRNVTDATYLRSVIESEFEDHRRLFISAPIQSRKDKISRYFLHPGNRWYVRCDFDPSILSESPEQIQLLMDAVGMQMLLGGGYPYVIHHAHHLSTIQGDSREKIEALSYKFGLFAPTPKTLGKRRLSVKSGRSLDSRRLQGGD